MSRAIVATMVAPLAEMSRTRHPVSAPPYVALPGTESGPHPDAVSCHGSLASDGWSPVNPSSASSRSSRRCVSTSFEA